MANEKPLYTLYKGLKSNNYDVPDSYDSFERTLTEAGNGGAQSRHKLYEALKANNYDVPDNYERFYSTLFTPVNSTTSRAAGGTEEIRRAAKPQAASVLGGKSSSSMPSAPAPQPQKPVQKPTTATRPALKPRQSGTPLSEADKQKMLSETSQMLAQTQAGLQRTKNRMDYMSANTGLQVPKVKLGEKGGGIRLGQNSKVVSRKKLNPETGKEEQTFITESGNEFAGRAEADLEQNNVDDARYQLEHREDWLRQQRRALVARLAKRGQELDAEAVDFSWRDMPRGSGGAIHTYNSSTVNGRFADAQYKNMLAQIKKIDDTLATLEEARKGVASDKWIDDSSNWAAKKGKQLLAFGAGAWRGLAHAVGKVSTWDMGLTDINTNGSVLDAAQNADKYGFDNISQDERDLLNLTAISNEVQSENADHIGWGYDGGEMIGGSLPFMLEMILNPASGLGEAAVKRMTQEAIKRYGKEAVKKAAKKYLAAKIGTRLIGDVAGSAVMAGTSGLGHVTADTLNRLTGDVQFKQDETGHIVYGGREGAEDSVAKAFLKAFGAQTIENHSEMVGEYFAPLLGKASKVVRKGMDKVGLGSVNRFIDNVGATNFAKMIGDFEKHSKWNGTIGEYAEEVVGNIENALLVGDNTLDTAKDTGVFNGEQNAKTFLGVGLMSGFISGAKTLSYRGPKRQAMNEMSEAGRAIDRAIGGDIHWMEKWGGWRNTFLVGTDEEKTAALREVMDDANLPMGFRMGVLNFVKAAQKYEGLTRAQESKLQNGEQDPVAAAYDESYDRGYDTTEPEAMNDAKNLLDMKRGQLAQQLGIENADEVDDHIGDPLRYIDEQRKLGNTEGLQTVIDYANAKSAYEGMLQRVRDDIDSQVEESDRTVSSHMNRTDGMIHPATLKEQNEDGTGKNVYIVSGNVVMTDDGSGVDTEKSDDTIVIRDALTGEMQQVAPDAIFHVDESIDPEEEKATAAEAIRQQMAQQAANNVDGAVPFAFGDSYTLTAPDGSQQSIAIVANEQGLVDNGDGTVNVTVDGQTVVPMSKEEIQQGVNATNMARTAQAEQERLAQQAEAEQQRQAAEAETNRPHYGVNDIFTVTDENGTPIRGNVQGITEDGVEIYTEAPLNGKCVQVVPAEVFEGMVDNISDADGNPIWAREVAEQQPTNEVEQPTDDHIADGGNMVKEDNVDENKPSEASLSLSAPLTEEGEPSAQQTETAQNTETAEGAAPLHEEAAPTEHEPSALERVPRNENGEPVFEQAESPDVAWDALVEFSGGDAATAKEIADAMTEEKRKTLEKAQKLKLKGKTPMEMLASKQANAAELAKAENEFNQWQRMATVEQSRQNAIRVQQEAEARQRAAERADAEKAEREAREEAERKEREAINGVPDWVDDTPQDARARGFRRSGGGKFDRQQPLVDSEYKPSEASLSLSTPLGEEGEGGNTAPIAVGKEVEVKFTDKVKQKGRVAVVEAATMQPSHYNGQPNVLHFIPEAQPKKRTDDASVASSEDIAANINPEEITSSVTAYTGAPTLNARGETIQGNNRTAALKRMWESHADQAAKYKQYLMEHAGEFGLNADDIAQMKQPVLANIVDVDDAKAIELGQYDVKDTESGGTERIKAKNAVVKMGNDMKHFASVLLSSADDEASFSQLVDKNGDTVLKWMNQKGYITPTQYKSAFDSKGNLTAEAANDLKGIMYQSIFQNGNERLEEVFNTLPAKAQRAILATMYRDYDSPAAERMVPEVQASIMAYNELMQNDSFAGAKNMKEAQMAVMMWQRQYQFDDATGESYLPTEKYSNFALQLAAMYRVQTQSLIQGTFNQMFDLIQGTQEANLFNQDTLDNTPRTLVEAIKEALNIDYNGQQRSNVMADDSAASQQRRQGRRGDASADGRGESGSRTAERERGTGVSDNERGAESRDRELDNNGRIAERREKILANMGDKYALSTEKANNGELFIQNENGSTTLAIIPDEIFDRIGLNPVPFKLTETMGWHVYDHHKKEAKLNSVSDAVDFVLSIVNNVDHVRLGRDNTYIFSVEDNRNKLGRRAITIMVNSKTGEFMGIRTSGYETIKKLKERPLLWERGAHAVPEDVATPTITTIKPQHGDKATSRTKSQSNGSSADEISTISSTPKSEVAGSSDFSTLDDTDKVTNNQRELQTNNGKSAGREEDKLSSKVAAASEEVNTHPTEAQKEAATDRYGIPAEAKIYWRKKAGKDGIIKGMSANDLRITARYDTRTGVTTLRVDVWDDNAESPARIAAILEKEGYDVDMDGSSSGFVEFDNYEEAKKFADHVDEVQKQVDKERAAAPLSVADLQKADEKRKAESEDIFQKAERIAKEEEKKREEKKKVLPIGTGLFGDIYDKFKGKAKEAFEFLVSHGSGDLLGVFHRDGVGDIDVVWGDKGGGLDHIISKHVGEGKSFANIGEAAHTIKVIINKGKIDFENGDKIVFRKGSEIVTIRKNVRAKGKKIADKNWVLTAYDEMSADGGVSAIAPTNKGQAARTTGKSAHKVTNKEREEQGKGVEKVKEAEQAYRTALDHESDVEQEWEEKMQDYVFEHYPTQATLSAESTSEQGLREREAMRNDPVLKKMREDAKAATDKAREASAAALARLEAANDGKLRFQKADDVEAMAKEHGVDAAWLARYADGMKEKNSAAAWAAMHDLKALYLREHISEKKALMEREGVNGLIANRRLFAPIEKAIKEKYGDVDVLVEERRKQAEIERGVMETARKRAEEEQRKREARLEELAQLTDEEIDKRYAEALAKGDEATAREMLDEAARRKGYGDAESDYQGVGAWGAPSKPAYESDEARRNAVGEDSPDLNVEDMAAGYSNQPQDIFAHPGKYSQGLPTSEESGKAIQTAIDAIRSGKKDVKIKVYRAVPASIKEGKLRNGDWVTPSRKYAELHGESRLEGKYRIIEDEVPANELWWDSNDVNEWGYDNGKNYRYKNVKNNRKLNDLVTRDDKGNVIPPSKRFNSRKADERYQKADEEQAKADKRERVLRDEVVGTMRKAGLDVSMDAGEGQRVLDEANGEARMSAKKRRALETVSVPRDEKHQPTVVSSADGAKVLNELDTTKEKYENQSNRTNTFLGDVAKALGAERHGSASEYATFETKNGRIVTIRLANHNAKVSNFDNRDESEGISIVVSPKKSEGMTNDGAAHVVEYYYDAIRLRRAEGKPLADIVRSIKQALYSGEFTDTTGLAERQEVNADDVVRYNKVYHGSGADFDHFDHSHMGEGEGGQAYGWGTYVTEVEGIGRTYADTGFFHAEDRRAERSETPLGKVVDAIIGQEKYNTTAKNFEQRKAVVIENLERALSTFAIWLERKDKEIPAFYRDDVEEAQTELDILRTLTEEQYNEERMKQGRMRHLYTVEIPDDTGENYLDRNGYPTGEQLGNIAKHLEANGWARTDNGHLIRLEKDGRNIVLNGRAKGQDLYEELKEAFGSDKKASKILNDVGFVGIKYPADFMRGGRADGKQNYVIFDEADAQITDHVRFFRTADGEAYDYTIGGKIYIDPRTANAETPVHEYAHLWATALRNGNAEEWKNVVELMKDTKVWDEVKKRYPELKVDDDIADEVLATYSGRRGAERLREEMRKATEGNGGVMEKAEAVSALERVREALKRFWKGVADMLHIHYTSAEEVADRVMKDLLDGVDPRGFGVDEKVRKMSFGERYDYDRYPFGRVEPHLSEKEVKVVEADADHGFKNYKEARTWAKEHVARTYTGEETGGKGDVRISNAAVDKFLSQSAVDKSDTKDVHMAVLKVLPKVLRTSIDVETHPDFLKGEDGKRRVGNGVNKDVLVHRCYGAVSIDGKPYRVKITLKEDVKNNEANKAYSYEATKIELLEGTVSKTEGSLDLVPSNSKPGLSAGQHGKAFGLTSAFPRYSDNSIAAAKLLKDVVMSYNSSEKVLDASEKRAEGADEGEDMYRVVDDKATIERLEREPKMTAYRAMQVIDGRLYSPMAAKVDGRLTADNPVGAWTEAEETVFDFTPEQKAAMEKLDNSKKKGDVEIIKGKLRYHKESEGGRGTLQFHLVKGDGTSLWAAYNPYIHSSLMMLNDQFTSAYKRPNIVVVEVEIPKSELTSGYRAERAKDPVGMAEWKAGPVAGQLPSDMGRKVMLSRWSKVKRIVPYSEVADHVASILEAAEAKNGERLTLPIDSFHPELRKELEKRGFKFEYGQYTKEKTDKNGNVQTAWDEKSDAEKRKAYKGASYMDDAAINELNEELGGKWLKREGEGVYSDEELSWANDPMSKMLGRSRWSKRQQGEFAARERERMASRVEELADKLHLNNVEVVTDASTLEGRRKRAKGFYNKRSGKITIVIPNHASMADVEQTLLHEAVAHYGLRELFGEHFDTFLDNVYSHAELPIRKQIAELARKNGWDFRKATEEYLASLAEDTDFEGLNKGRGFYGWWSFVKRAFLDMLHKIGFGEYDGPELSDNELRYILWRSYENLKEPGRYRSVLGEAADMSKQMDLKVGNFAKIGEQTMDKASEESATIAAMKQKVTDLFEKARTGEFKGKPEGIGRLGAEGKAYLENLSGLHLKEYVDFVLNPSDLNHIRSDHYGENEKDKGNNVPLTDEDIRNMVDVLNQPDGILYGIDKNDGRKLFFFLKDAGNGLYNLTEVCSTKKGNLTAKSFFKSKKKGINQRVVEIEQSLLPTSVTYSGASLSSDAKILNMFEIKEEKSENILDEEDMFRDGDSVGYEKAQARNRYEERVSRGMYQMQEAMQDSMLGLKEAMDAILGAEGKKLYIEDVAGYENAYLGENRLSSVNQAECNAFARTLFKPLLEEVAKLAKTADERAELTDYMMAKHGLERNEVMARRAAEKKAKEEFKAELRKAERAAAKDPLDQDAQDALDDVKQRQHDREEELYFENRGRDYSGLTALTGMDNVVDAEAEAQRMVSDYESSHDTTDLWNWVNDVTNATLSKTYESGLISKATYDDIRTMYKHYIPLRGFDEKTSDEAYAYLQDKHSAFNAPIKIAKGRKSKADDPFANMESMAESAIMQGNRNMLVKQKFLNFVLNHPSDLVSVSDLWLRYDDAADEWKPVNTGDVAGTERLEETDSPAEVERKMQNFEAAMEQLAAHEPDKWKKQKENPDVPYRVVSDQDLREHQVLVKRGGKDYLLTINGNPRAAQALNGQTNPDSRMEGAFKHVFELAGDVNRTLSMVYTTLQPDFVVSNFMRDTLYANSMVWVKESPEYARRYNLNYVKTKRVMSLLGKLRKGTLDMNDETERQFKQFIENGGETGYMRMADIDEHKKEIKAFLKAANAKIPAHEVMECWGTWLGEVSRGIEMRARFAAYLTSREMGRSIDRSIWDAKEISVNFNKKGAGDRFMDAQGQTMLGKTAAGMSGAGRATFLFWNASIQGTFGNFGKNLVRHPGKMAAVIGANFMLGLLVSALAASGGDGDDSYYDIPEHVRRQNFVVKGPGRTWIKVPLPMEYRAVYGMGELAGSTIFHGEELDAGELAGQMTQLLPVDMMEGTSGMWPSSIKPAVDVARNESWYGSPIWKETEWNQYRPQWTKAYKSANPDLVNLAAVLNEKTGGSKYRKGVVDMNPAAVEYLLKQYTGGFFTVVNQLRNLSEVGMDKKDFDWRYVPLANRVVMTGGDERNVSRGLNDKFFRYMERYRAKDSEFYAIRSDATLPLEKKAELVSEIVSEPGFKELRVASLKFSRLNTVLKRLKETGDEERAAKVERDIKELKLNLVRKMEALDKRK